MDKERAMKLYNEGKNDTFIAKELGISKTVVWKWRKDNSLAPNFKQGGYKGMNKTRREYQEPDVPEFERPWEDPDSLFCDGKFLEELTGKKPRNMEVCKK